MGSLRFSFGGMLAQAPCFNANFATVFIGIETPNEASLRETKKFQNLRKGGTMLDKVHAIQRAGLEVWSGMILGFDNDDTRIFELPRRFIREARIVNALVNMLVAIPKTPLYARLMREGRFDTADEPIYGTNVIPLKMTRTELRDGAFAVMRDLYLPEAYFDRLDALYLELRLKPEQARMRYLQGHPGKWLRINALFLAQAIGVFLRLMWGVPDATLRREYRKRLWRVLGLRPEPVVLRLYALKCAIHYHLHTMIWHRRNLGMGVEIQWKAQEIADQPITPRRRTAP